MCVGYTRARAYIDFRSSRVFDARAQEWWYIEAEAEAVCSRGPRSESGSNSESKERCYLVYRATLFGPRCAPRDR